MTRRVLAVALVVLVLLASFAPLVHAREQVAFLGDSITEMWRYPRANFGIHGQTTAEMLQREPAILGTHTYKTIVILGGTNDTLLHVADTTTIANLEQMASAAQAAGVQPVLCKLPPIFHSFRPDDHNDYGPAVQKLNGEIATLAAAHGWPLVDYYTPLAGHPAYSVDGVHMKRPAYLLMELALLRRVH